MKREQAEDVIVFANIIIKAYYNSFYKSLSLFKKSKIYLRLYYGYKILGLSNHKLYNQRVGSFKILEKVGKLAYRLKLPLLIRIHSIIFVAQLKPDFEKDNFEENSYMRDRVIATPEVKEDKTIIDLFEIETLLKKQVSRDKVQYLVKWKNSDNQYNV